LRARVNASPAQPLSLNDAHFPALRLGHGFEPSHAPAPNGLQAKLVINEAGDQYEQEADRVAEQVMRMPDPALRLQRKCGCGGGTESCESCGPGSVQLQRRATQENSSLAETAPTIVHDVLRSPGQRLDAATRAFMEPRFNYDFSSVRVHTGPAAAESARAVNALAYTVGRDVVFGALQYSVGTVEGKKLLAHELAHVAQQGAEPIIRRALPPTAEAANITRLRQLLQNDDESAAITLMGGLSPAEVQQVFASREFKELAISAFNDEEMYRGVRAMHGDLYPSLEWMFDEGTNWQSVRDVIGRAPSGKERVRADNWMKGRFVDICNIGEITIAVDLLGGTLLQKLTWMKAEGSNWPLVRTKIQATTDASEKLALYDSPDMRSFFVDVCNDNTMAQAVDLLGGTLLQKLTWMKAEGSNWSLVRAKIVATAAANEKLVLYGISAMRDFFVDICSDRQMTEAVELLGGTLLQKINWMLAEETDAEFIYSVIRVAPPAELPTVAANPAYMNGLRSLLSRTEFQRVQQMLTQGLLHWEEKSSSPDEHHYEQNGPTSPWKLKEFTVETGYEIRYTRTELRVVVRIRLTGVPSPAALQTTWITGIQNRWNNQFHIENSRRLAVVFDPIFTAANYQHSVQVQNPPATGITREDESNFYTNTSPDVAAHEFGHMVGLEDEYRLTAADYQRLSGTAVPAGAAPAQGYTIPGLMVAGGGPVQGRHLAPFLQWLNSHRLAGERPYRLVAGP
jgi:hypothetical protein